MLPPRFSFVLRSAFRGLRACLPGLAFVLAACGGQGASSGAQSTPAALPVEVASVLQQPITASYSGTATLEPVAEASVVAKTGGIVLKLLVEEGAQVRKGQVLAVLDDQAARNKVEQAEANWRKAQAAFDKAQKGWALKITPRTQYDSDKFDLAAQKAVLDGARLELSWTRIEAPIAGVVARRLVKAGNLVQTNEELFRIVDMQPLQAVLNVPERDLHVLQPGQPVKLRVDALPGKVFDGEVARIAPVVDAASGTFRATCEFRDDGRRLMPGMFGRIEVAYDQRQDALVIPRQALVEEDGETAVFVLEPAPVAPPPAVKGKRGEAVAADAAPALPGFVARRRLITTGYADGDRVEVRDGLAAGERVITIGRNAVRDGAPVQAIEPAPTISTVKPDAA
ncbi:efflux RND transporter periplasmic adaptor subunit [Dokdonella sp.]|uniref:efflux RND transporter periplasmic adaptor subunit n=1 Tax=Dokdonella sp. TaxID=2291710 RepID=UPI0031C78BCB|nr:efflux RND transporter periplasmic adaptor subunit [Dokdonella sp.]